MRKGREIIISLSGVLLFAALWQLAAHARDSPALPPVSHILMTALRLITDGTYTPHIAASLSIVLLGTGTAALIGVTLGILLFQFRNFRTAALPVIECVRGVAALTLFPLLIVLFGLGMFSRAFVIFWTAWPAVVLSTVESLNVDKSIVEAAHDLGAGDLTIMIQIRIPMAAQGIVTGIRIGVSGGWIGLIAAEMLGASKGLGYYLLWSSQAFEFEKVYATIIVIALIGGLMNYILLFLQKKLLRFTGGI